MAVKVGEAYYDLTARTDKLEGELKKVQAQFDKFSKDGNKSLTEMIPAWARVSAEIAVVAAAMYKCIKAESDLNEVTSKFNVVFGKNIDAASKSVENLTSNYAMSTREARQYLSSIQDLLVPMGMNADLATKYSDEVVRLSADLGSFNNMPTADVMMDIQSALVGNYETMKKYGVVLGEEAVKREAVRMGLAKQGEELAQVNKVQAAYSLILKGTQAAQGDMIRTGDQYANQVKKLKSNLEDMYADIGKQMMPGASKLVTAFSDVTKEGSALRTILKDLGEIGGKGLSKLAIGVYGVNKAIANLRLVWLEAKLVLDEGFSYSFDNIDELIKKMNMHGTETEMYKKLRAVYDAYYQVIEAENLYSNATNGVIKVNDKAVDSYGDVLTELQKQQNINNKIAEEKKKQLEKEQELLQKFKEDVMKTSGEIVSGIGQIVDSVFQGQISAIDKAYERQQDFLDYFKAKQLEQAGFVDQTDRQKNDAAIYNLTDQINKEQNAKKKAALQEQLNEKMHLRKKYQIEAQYEMNKFALEQIMERRKNAVMRQQAIAQRAFSLLQIGQATAVAIMQAWAGSFSSVPLPPAAAAMAAVMTGLISVMAAIQTAAVLSAPLPTAAKGMVSNRPAIFGEAGLEMAVPLASTNGRRAINMFTSSLIDEVNRRESNRSSGATYASSGSGSSSGDYASSGGDVYLDSDKVGKWFTKQAVNGLIRIPARAVR